MGNVYFNGDNSNRIIYENSATTYLNGLYFNGIYYESGTICCLVKGTSILTLNGYVNIEDLQKGTKVYTLNEETLQIEIGEVVNHGGHLETEKELYKITIEENQIGATYNHKFYCKVSLENEAQWLETQNIQKGYYLYSSNQGWIQIDNIETYKEEIWVYDIDIEENDNYFVGNLNICAHNASCK